MGLFVLPQSNDTIDIIKAARRNIELFLNDNPEDGVLVRYLLDQFALRQLDEAIKI